MKTQLFGLILLSALSFQKVSAQELKTNSSTDSMLTLHSMIEDDEITLEWDSQRAVNVRVFIIERSTDENPFELLAIIPADNRFPVNKRYHYKDDGMLLDPGVNLQYRLKAIYMNGKQELSIADIGKDKTGLISSR